MAIINATHLFYYNAPHLAQHFEDLNPELPRRCYDECTQAIAVAPPLPIKAI